MTAVARDGRSAARSRERHPTAHRVTDQGPAAPTLRGSALYRLLLIAALGLSLLGAVMVLSASSAEAIGGGDPWAPFMRQLVWLGVGLIAMGITSRIHYRQWADRFSRLVIVVAIIMLVVVLIPQVGRDINGAKRWIGYGSYFSFQPSEFAKFAMIVWSADLLSRKQRRLDNPHHTIYPLLVTTGIVVMLLLLEPDLGTSILIGSLVLLLMFVAGASLKHIGLVGAVSLGGAFVLAMGADYRRERLLAFRNPWADPLDATYNTVQAGVSVANGGIQGVGLGASRGKWGYLPYAQSDFVYALVAEELGFIGGIAVLSSFVLLAILGFTVGFGMREVDPFASLLAIGITAWILLQSFINIGASVGALPITGMTLPFVSAGGSSLVVMLAAFGVLLNVARHAR